MGVRSFLRGDDLREDRSEQPAGETRSLPPAENQLPLMGAYTSSTVTPAAALAIADVWAAVRVLADAASSLPLHVYRKTDTGRERVTSGRLVELLDRPGPATSQADLVSSLMAHLAIYGNGFLAKYREQGEVVQLGLLHPERIRPELEGGRLRFRYSPGTGPQQLLTEADVVHIKGLSVDGLVGLSAVSQAARVLGLSDELVKHALAFFDSGVPRPGGVLRLDEWTSNEAQERMYETLRAQGRPHGLLVIRGPAEYMEIASKLDDSQFVEQRRLAAQEIARVFRIPSHIPECRHRRRQPHVLHRRVDVDRLRQVQPHAVVAPCRVGAQQRPGSLLPAAVPEIRARRVVEARQRRPRGLLREGARSDHGMAEP